MEDNESASSFIKMQSIPNFELVTLPKKYVRNKYDACKSTPDTFQHNNMYTFENDVDTIPCKLGVES